MPRVSIVLPTYNRLAYLQEAVASVLAQTFTDWELFIVDDGSTDETCAWVRSLGDARVTLIALEHTGNKSLVRNRGIAIARGEFVAFLDSDDLWAPAKLEKQLGFHASRPQFRWSYTLFNFIDKRGDPIPASRFGALTVCEGWILERIVTTEAKVALPSVMAQRTLLQEAGGFDEACMSAEDLELWLRLAERCECGAMEERLLDVRKHRDDWTQNPAVSVANVRIFRRALRRRHKRRQGAASPPFLGARQVLSCRAVGIPSRQRWAVAQRGRLRASRRAPPAIFAG